MGCMSCRRKEARKKKERKTTSHRGEELLIPASSLCVLCLETKKVGGLQEGHGYTKLIVQQLKNKKKHKLQFSFFTFSHIMTTLVMDYHTPLGGSADVAPLLQKPTSNTRDKVVEELLETESRYMHDMERLEVGQDTWK